MRVLDQFSGPIDQLICACQLTEEKQVHIHMLPRSRGAPLGVHTISPGPYSSILTGTRLGPRLHCNELGNTVLPTHKLPYSQEVTV